MAYATSNPPKLLQQAIGNRGPSFWTYDGTDNQAAVNTSGYITNGGQLGMKVGDLVFVTNTSASPPTVYSHRVVSVSATAPGAVDLDDGVQLAGAGNAD